MFAEVTDICLALQLDIQGTPSLYNLMIAA